ncbi:MAG: hypothetical protein PHT64_00110 [Bacteroidales bacterium]|nr:hypothetical protein [Bacteroidales bacterium]MDD3521328.1 hypothetical protein [Bacteroidales bacterium]MDD4030608.1 hypothetical protein [Bacteroidales bacterium]MDD4434703.1 hypothetical protein [Bacteroidales bacterium]MDD5732185.1 hypothetical protein [Bacteroidales bacterium]
MQRLKAILSLVIISLHVFGCGNDNGIPPPDIHQPGNGSELNKPVPAWSAGQMDIHFINTTDGESIFIIFPDKTQMLIDCASSAATTGKTEMDKRWNPTELGSTLITSYIKKCMEWTGNRTLDYAVLTHFHNDHFGGYATKYAMTSLGGDYRNYGYAEILDKFDSGDGYKIGKLVDRAYPDYNYPFDLVTKSTNYNGVSNYINAVRWHVKNKSMKAEIFNSGSNSQFVLNYSPSQYPSFKVQNICVNGEIWTGSGTSVNKTFPALENIKCTFDSNGRADVQNGDDCPEENHNSIVMKISYGKFDFYTGGDMQYDGRSYKSWKDIELPVARVTGQVEVMKANHHGVTNTNQVDAVKALDPQAVIITTWQDLHPRTLVLESMLSAAPAADFFITNLVTSPRSDKDISTAVAARVKGKNGHILIRVSAGGEDYKIYTLSDSDGKMNVHSISGPYKSR